MISSDIECNSILCWVYWKRAHYNPLFNWWKTVVKSFFFLSLFQVKGSKCEIFSSPVTVSLAFYVTLVDFVSYWKRMKYNQSTQVRFFVWFFFRLLSRCAYSIGCWLKKVPIMALGILNGWRWWCKCKSQKQYKSKVPITAFFLFGCIDFQVQLF